MVFRTDRCLVTIYCCWRSPGENLWQNELKQTGQDLIWHERKPISRGERTPDMMPERRYCRQRWGQKYSSSLIMTLSTHNPGNINRSPWRPVPPKSAFVTPQKHKHFIDSEPLPVITTLWSCRAWIRLHKYSETRRTSAWAAFDKMISQSRTTPLYKRLSGRCTQKSMLNKAVKM